MTSLGFAGVALFCLGQIELVHAVDRREPDASEFEDDGDDLGSRDTDDPIEAQGPPALLRPPGFPEPRPEAPPAPPELKWHDNLTFGAFADAYAGVNWGFPHPQTGTNVARAFDESNGFAFAWAGLDASYDADTVGGTMALRFGPSAAVFSGEPVGSGLNLVKQGFVTWKPARAQGKLSFDLGKFDTLYGAEVAESWLNMNYTRGVLNWLGQPFHHTGLRVGVAPRDTFGFNLLAVNGWNNSRDNNLGKTFGAQLALTPKDGVAVYVGYLTGPENDDLTTVFCGPGTAFDPDTGLCTPDPTNAVGQEVSVETRDANRKFRHFVDVVAAIDPTDWLAIVFNADVGIDPVITNPVTGDSDTMVWFGAMASARYAITARWAAALRGEYYHDFDDYTTGVGTSEAVQLGTATATVEFAPVRSLIIRLDNRLDVATERMFARGYASAGKSQVTTTLGVVVTSF
ncbi:MAG: porin [Myxococcales bacterium FL481]|nr:MAG: porin [Myxococcales bacterium FL481]